MKLYGFCFYMYIVAHSITIVIRIGIAVSVFQNEEVKIERGSVWIGSDH